MKHRPSIRAAGIAVVVAMAACSGGDDGGQQAEVGEVSANTSSDTSADDATTADQSADATSGDGEADPQTPMVLVMDASGSMEATDGDGRTLLDGAKAALGDVIEALPDGTPTGLLVYGHRIPNTDEVNGCRDTELIHPVEPLDRDAMRTAIAGFQAKGFTPIGRALEEAAAALPPEGERSIVLVSDGEDTCTPPDPCEVAEQLRADGVDLIINTVGFALGDDETARNQLQCVAEAGGGEYRDAADAAELAETLADVSVRDAREADLSGSVLEGAPLPRDAATGEVDTSYSDLVLAREVNFYRFEVEPGSELTAESVIIGRTGTDDGCSPATMVHVRLTDAGDDAYESDFRVVPNPGETEIIHLDPVVVDDDEAFIKIDTSACGGTEDEFDVEVRLSTS